MPRYRDALYGGETVVLENAQVRLEVHKRSTGWGWGELFVPDNDEGWRLFAVLEHLAPVAEELGVRVTLENHAENNIENLADYEAILTAITSPAVGICIDTGHFDAADVDMDELIDRLGERVNHIHVKENRGRGKVAFTRFGEGTTDNHHVIRRMLERGFSGCITCELSPQERPSTVEDLRTAYEMFCQYEATT